MKKLKTMLLDTPGAGRCSHPKGFHKSSKGRNPDGTWKTAKLKQYPADLCHTIMRAFKQEMAEAYTGPEPNSELHECRECLGNLDVFYQQMDPYMPELIEQTMAPDFHSSTKTRKKTDPGFDEVLDSEKKEAAGETTTQDSKDTQNETTDMSKDIHRHIKILRKEARRITKDRIEMIEEDARGLFNRIDDLVTKGHGIRGDAVINITKIIEVKITEAEAMMRVMPPSDNDDE